MKGTASICIALVFALAVSAGCVSAPAGNTPIPATTVVQDERPHYVIGVDRDFPPFTAQDASENFTGFDIEAARWVAGREGIEVTFVAVPWDSIVPALENKTIDLVWSGMTMTESRQARVNFSVPYYSTNQSIAARAGSPFTVQDLTLGRLRVGVQEGSSEAEWVTDNLIRPGKMPTSNLSQYPDITTLTAALENGTVDVSIVQLPSQQSAIQGRPLVIIGTTPSQDTYAVAVRKTDTALLGTVNDGLVQLMNDPSWQQLKEKYRLA